MANWYETKKYDLGEARTNYQIKDFPEDGDCILVLLNENTTLAETYLKFNSPNSHSFDLYQHRRLRHRFKTLYLTNVAANDKTLRLLIGKGPFALALAIESKRIGPGEETEMTGVQIVVLLEGLTGNNRLSADAIRDGDTNKVFTAAEKSKLATGVNLWNLLTGSLNNEQYIPFKNVAGAVKEILRVNDADETELRSAGEDIVIHVPQEGKNVKIVKEYF